METIELLTHPVSADEQPELWRLVHDTARRAGLSAPESIELYPAAEVQVHRNRLLLGLPYVTDLAADELAAVVAHELAFSQTRRTSDDWVVRRVATREVVVASARHAVSGSFAASSAPSVAGGWPTVGTAAASPPLSGSAAARSAARRVAFAADALAAEIVSPEVAAAALVRAAHLGIAFNGFVQHYVRPLAEAGWYPVDLWDGWRWTMRGQHTRQSQSQSQEQVQTSAPHRPAGAARPGEGRHGPHAHSVRRFRVGTTAGAGTGTDGMGTGAVAGAAATADSSCRGLIRGGLAARVAALVGGSPEVGSRLNGPRGRPVRLRPLGAVVEAGFARVIAEGLSGSRELRPATFDGLADDVWDLGMRRRAEAVRRAAGRLLGLPAAFVPDILDLVAAGRSTEILRCSRAEAPEIDAVTRVMTPLLYEALRFRGYRVVHPLRQHELIGPAHDRIDLEELLAPAECGAPLPARVQDILLAH